MWNPITELNLPIPDDTIFILTKHGRQNTMVQTYCWPARCKRRDITVFVTLGLPWSLLKHCLAVRKVHDSYELQFVSTFDHLDQITHMQLDTFIGERVMTSTAYKKGISAIRDRPIRCSSFAHDMKACAPKTLVYSLDLSKEADSPMKLMRSEVGYIQRHGWGLLNSLLNGNAEDQHARLITELTARITSHHEALSVTADAVGVMPLPQVLLIRRKQQKELDAALDQYAALTKAN